MEKEKTVGGGGGRTVGGDVTMRCNSIRAAAYTQHTRTPWEERRLCTPASYLAPIHPLQPNANEKEK